MLLLGTDGVVTNYNNYFEHSTEKVVYADIYTMRFGVDSCNGSINGRQKALKVLDQAMPFCMKIYFRHGT